MLSVMSPVDGIGQVKGIELMVKCELPRRYIAVDSIGGPEGGPSCTLIGVLSSHRRQYGWTLRYPHLPHHTNHLRISLPDSQVASDHINTFTYQ